MQYIAIMKKSWGLLPKILTGEKKIESRWYNNRYSPWDKIKKGRKQKNYATGGSTIINKQVV